MASPAVGNRPADTQPAGCAIHRSPKPAGRTQPSNGWQHPAKQRIDSLQRTLGQKVFARHFNRRDVDAIYLYASPLEAGIIKSFLDIK